MDRVTPRGWAFYLLFGLAASLANNIIIRFSLYFESGLYLDTIFTVAAAFSAGLFPALVSALCTTLIFGISQGFVTGTPYFWGFYAFMICSVLAALLARLFARFFPELFGNVRIGGKEDERSRPLETPSGLKFFETLVMLAVLSLAMCLLMSVSGGLISAIITGATGVVHQDAPPETWFRMGFIRQGFSLTAAEILGRIPVNMADRPITVFGAYGIAMLVKRLFRSKPQFRIISSK